MPNSDLTSVMNQLLGGQPLTNTMYSGLPVYYTNLLGASESNPWPQAQVRYTLSNHIAVPGTGRILLDTNRMEQIRQEEIADALLKGTNAAWYGSIVSDPALYDTYTLEHESLHYQHPDWPEEKVQGHALGTVEVESKYAKRKKEPWKGYRHLLE